MELQRSLLETPGIITHSTKVSRAIKDGKYKEIQRSQDVLNISLKEMHRFLCDTKIGIPQFL